MRKFLLLAVFFILTPLVLIFSLIFLTFLSYQKNPTDALSYSPLAYAALPADQEQVLEQINQEDSRITSVREFFAKYKSPLEPFAQNVVLAADHYDLDYRLIPAIAMQESNLCKKAPEDSYNCWGFGIYGKKIKMFQNYEQAIETVTKTLAEDYKEGKGLATPSEIMTRYTPSNNGAWADSVTFFMNQL